MPILRPSAGIVLVGLIAFVAGCGTDSPATRNAAADSAFVSGPRPAPQVIAKAVDSLAESVIAQGLTPALGVAVVMDGRTILSKSYGMADVTNRVPANDSTLWYVASTSKSFTGFATALLAHQGVIDFHASMTALLPKAQWPDGVNAAELTLADFLSHTHQLRDAAIVMSTAFTAEFPEPQWPSMLRYAKYEGGRDLVYSNLGYNVAAMVIDARRPEGWRRYLDSAVFKPAGMTQTYTRVSGLEDRIAMPHDLLASGQFVRRRFQKVDATMHSAGGQLATMHDLARWVTVQMDTGVIDGKRVFPFPAVTLSHRLIARQTRDESRTFSFFNRESWAAGWDIGSYQGEPMVSRFGSYASLRSHLSFLPQRRIGVVAQANGRVASEATDILAAFAYDLERGAPQARTLADQRLRRVVERRRAALAEQAHDDSVRASRRVPLKRPLADFAGSYRHEWYGTVKIDVLDDSVYYKWGVLSGPAEVVDARTCGWLGCHHYNALIIEAADNKMGVDFEFPESGPATVLKLRNEKFVRDTALRPGTAQTGRHAVTST